MNTEPEIYSARRAGSADNLVTSFLLRTYARLFHASTGENASLVATLEGRRNWIPTVCFTKDGTKLISGSWDETVRLWDVGTARKIGESISGHTARVISVSLSDDKQEITSVGGDGAMCAWKMDGNVERRVQFAQEGVFVRDAKIISDGDKVVWCDDDWVQVTDVRNYLPAHAPGSPNKDGVSAICVTPDGTRVITGSEGGTLMVWDTATGLLIGTTFKSHKSAALDVAVTPDRQRFVSVSRDMTVCSWDIATHKQLAVLKAQPANLNFWEIYHGNFSNCVEISLDAKTAITGSRNGTVLIWDLETCDGSHQVLDGHSDKVTGLYLARDGLHFVSLSKAGEILWNMEKAELVKRIEKENARWMPVDEIEDLFGVPVLSSLRMGDIHG